MFKQSVSRALDPLWGSQATNQTAYQCGFSAAQLAAQVKDQAIAGAGGKRGTEAQGSGLVG